MLQYHIIALILGFFIDLAIGDPYFLPHPIRLIGGLVAALDKKLRKGKEGKDMLWRGVCLVLLVTGIATAVPLLLLWTAYRLHPYAGLVAETVMCYQILATKSLKTESMKVYQALQIGDLEKSRYAVSMIVGRDTKGLTQEGVVKAAVETVAENTSDGIIAPMLYIALGGAALGFFYKAVNTMDSMVGYKNDAYLYFGRAAAKLDDILNYLPARISALLMIAASFLCGYDGVKAFRIWRRDGRNHASPNSAQTEAVTAGALGIQLAGNAYYFGKLYEKPYIGDKEREAQTEDIRKANRLLYGTAFLQMAVIVLLSGCLKYLL